MPGGVAVRVTQGDRFARRISFSEATAHFNVNNAGEGECGCPTEPTPPDSVVASDTIELSPDLNADGIVDVQDSLILLGAWGTPGADLNDDGTTDVNDYLEVLQAWGRAG